MHWNGYAGWVMGVGGALGCDGAVRLHEDIVPSLFV